MKCIICSSSEFDCIHKGTRDVPYINVMKCRNCGMVQLDSNAYNTEGKYSEGDMLKDTYSAVTDSRADMTWEIWVESTKQDDDRRYNALKDTCAGKKVLEFGCGHGGFLRRIKGSAMDVIGIELMDEARERINSDGIKVLKYIEETDVKFDVACMFNVIEHLDNPDEHLKKIYKALKPGGVFICETCNVNDALLTKYKCRAFADFTYWSEHVVLFNSETLEKIIGRNGFKTIENTQVERYTLGNHLYWLSEGKPGGHVKWAELDNETLNKAYEKMLAGYGIADTLWYIGKKE